MLLKQSGMYFYPCGASGTTSLGSGFFTTRAEAEQNRTREYLAMKEGSQDLFHIYELDIPNPAYKK
jgi:hypothetical protein